MTINISLSTDSIREAIETLSMYRDIFEDGVKTVVDILAQEGAMVANAAYGGMAKARAESNDTSAQIIVSGKAPGIAEFGAGYATMEFHPFADRAPYPVEVGSYSRAQRPYGLFYITNDLTDGTDGYWIFGGQYYDRVEPRHGLLDAYDHIMAESTEIAKGVLSL